jgi:predicted dehydrogenase
MATQDSSTTAARRIRLGMVGGGRDAFIGGVHRIASRIDDRYELVAGAFSSTPEKSKASAADLGVAPDRAYGDYVEMAKREARLKIGIEAVAIVTPNHMHYPVAREFLKRGIHVICDKPLTSTLADAKKLAKAAESSGALFVLTHNYTGYPMIRQAREMVQGGELGRIRLVQVEYAQDWLSENLEETGQKQAGWRTDPARSGLGGSTGDIGTHAFNLASFVSGLELAELCADLDSFVEGRKLDDNGHVLMRFAGGAKGMLWCSQVAPGNENALKLESTAKRAGSNGPRKTRTISGTHRWANPSGFSPAMVRAQRPPASASAASRAVIPKAISKASPPSTMKPPKPSSRTATASLPPKA